MNKRQFKKHPELSVKNFKLWKKELDKVAEPYLGENLSKTRTDIEWLEEFIGCTPSEIVTDEISYSQ